MNKKRKIISISDNTELRSINNKPIYIYPDVCLGDNGGYVTVCTTNEPFMHGTGIICSGAHFMSFEDAKQSGGIFLFIRDIGPHKLLQIIGLNGKITNLPYIMGQYNVHSTNSISCESDDIEIFREEQNVNDAKTSVMDLLDALTDINIKESKSKERNVISSSGNLSKSICENVLENIVSQKELNLDRLSISIGLALRDIKLLMNEHGISDEDILSAVHNRRIRK